MRADSRKTSQSERGRSHARTTCTRHFASRPESEHNSMLPPTLKPISHHQTRQPTLIRMSQSSGNKATSQVASNRLVKQDDQLHVRKATKQEDDDDNKNKSNSLQAAMKRTKSKVRATNTRQVAATMSQIDANLILGVEATQISERRPLIRTQANQMKNSTECDVSAVAACAKTALHDSASCPLQMCYHNHQKCRPQRRHTHNKARQMIVNLMGTLAASFLLLLLVGAFQSSQAVAPLEQTLKFDPTTNSYSGLTFTFEPQLDKQVQDRLHFDHWLAIMQHTSNLMYESLNGRAHLNELRVLIPYKWRQLGSGWPMLHKPGSPIISNRRLRYADADVLVGNEDPVYKETPFALQHDECGRPGLQIRMPIGFLEPAPIRAGQAEDARLKGRQLLREFASHRYGVFKESGFRNDFMYPPFTSIAGLPTSNLTYRSLADLSELRNLTGLNRQTARPESADDEPAATEEIRGFDQNLRECKFESSAASGLPLAHSATCAPYLVRTPSTQQSFNLMGADLFTHATSESANLAPVGRQAADDDRAPLRPIEWNEQLAELTTWHFCGENFPPLAQPATDGTNLEPTANSNNNLNGNRKSALTKSLHFGHNQRASTKQNKMCQERSALDVIRASEDFKSAQFSPSSFNRLPAPSFKFLQEMPPRLIMGIEYTLHLFQSRRLDHAMLVAAVNKLLAFDLIADSEIATILFGQHQARSLGLFQRLEASTSSRFAIFNPAIDPFEEQPQLYSQHELLQLGIQPSPSEPNGQPILKILKGTCSFARLMGELNQLLARSGAQYEDADADVVLLTSGLFVEDEQKIEDLIRTSNFKQTQNRLDLVIYPSGMLFDTKSRDGYIVLDSRESELIIKSRVNKLLLIERLTGARIHLIREQLDASGDFKMSTLTQFYQVFERLAKGHSWDQTNSMMLLNSQQVDSRQILPKYQQPTASEHQPQQQQHALSFNFELDDSIQNELLVGFIDPKAPQHQANQPQSFPGALQSRAGKRFQLKNLELRSPGGHFVFTETGTFSNQPSTFNRTGNELEHIDEFGESARQQADAPAFFPHRAQLSLAAFHIRGSHLSQLQAAHKLAGTWTLSAVSDEPVQTSGLAMAQTNPSGDSLHGHCWIQTYRSDLLDDTTANSNALRQVKVFAQINGASELVQGRMEVQDEMGNIVQNVQMLDDGLGAPDITQNDGILSQLVQRATRAGFYKVMVELAVPHKQHKSTTRSQHSSVALASGHDNVCCGSSIPSDRPALSSGSSSSKQSKLPTRQLYCGTFHVEANNKLAQIRPPRINNLTAVSVDQDNRRITLRWFEPAVELSPVSSQLTANSRPSTNSQLISIVSDNDLLSDETIESSANEQQQQQQQGGRTRRRMPRLARVGSASRRQVESESEQEDDEQAQRLKLDNVLIASHQQGRSASLLADQLGPSSANQQQQQQLWSRYEIKLFTDRDVMKRTFDAKQEVGFRFNEWNVEGQLPNASQFGGMKEVTLRVPFAREGFYFVAMKVYNAQGISSQMSNIVQFYLRNNLTLEEVESIYSQPGTTMDADGNIYDKNGELIHQRVNGLQALGPFSLLRGSNALDGWSVLVLLSLLVFIVTIMCLTLVACLASSARQSLAKKNKSLIGGGGKSSGDDGKATGTTISSLVSGAGRGCGSGSSMVSQSSGCGSSQHSDVGACSSQDSPNFPMQQQQQHFHQDQVDSIMQTASELNLSKQMTTSYSQLQAQHKHQQHQAQLIHSQMISSYQQQQEQDFYNSPVGYNQSQLPPTDWRQQQQPLQHTLVNGYTYATVMPQSQHQQQFDASGQPIEQQQQQQQYQMFTGDLNQNGLGSATPNELQAAATNGQYERVKRDSVMRFSSTGAVDPLDGLPQVNEQSSPPTGAKLPPNYLNHQQLQQQLSSVLKSKRQQREAYESGSAAKSSSPALEGVTGEFEDGNIRHLAYTSAEQMAPPPPQYVYCTAPLDNNGLAPASHHQTLARDPSIYSQTTNLQQVSSSIHETNYYANHYDQPNSIGGHWPAQTGALNQQQQAADDSAAISEV